VYENKRGAMSTTELNTNETIAMKMAAKPIKRQRCKLRKTCRSLIIKDRQVVA